MSYSDLSAGEKLTAAKFNERLASYVDINGLATPASIRDSRNVSSVDDNGVGDYTINWDTDFAAAQYGCGSVSHNLRYVSYQDIQAGSLQINVATDAGALSDRSHVMIIALGDQT